MSEQDDRNLYNEFAALRAAESANAPEFERTRRAALARGHRSRLGSWRPIVAAAAGVAVVVLVLARSLVERETSVPRIGDLGTWATPTDVLLETPGRDLLRDLPRWDFTAPGTATDGSGASTSEFNRRNHA